MICAIFKTIIMTKYQKFLKDLKVGDLVAIMKRGQRDVAEIKKISKRCIYTTDNFYKTFDVSDGHCYIAYYCKIVEATEKDKERYNEEQLIKKLNTVLCQFGLSNKKKIEKVKELLNS